jgi:CRP-like cAMP-binding protein
MQQPASPPSSLSRAAIFRDLTPDQAAICEAAFTTAAFASGEMLFGRGEMGGRLYVVVSGRVRLSLVSEEGRELSVRIAGPGEILGEMAVFDGGARSADAVALDDVRALALARKDFERLLVTVPALASGIIRHLCQRLRETTDQLESIALHSVEQRLARLLLAEIGAGKGAGREAGKPLPRALMLPQAELAQLIGASRPKVNLALSALEREGAIRRSPEGASCNIDVLRRLSGLGDE